MHQELEALEEIVHVLDLGGEMSRSSMVGESSPSMILKQGKQAVEVRARAFALLAALSQPPVTAQSARASRP